MDYEVTFIQNYNYKIQAENEDEAFAQALKEFESDMRSPIAQVIWDDLEIIPCEEV